MDRQFINLMIESYIFDKNIYDNERNNIKYLVLEHIESLKSENNNLYNYLHDLSKTNQQRYLYSLIDTKYEHITEISIPDVSGWELGGYGIAFGGLLYAITLLFQDEPQFLSRVKLGISNITNAFKKAYLVFNKTRTKTNEAIDLLISNNYHNCLSKCDIPEEFYSEHNGALQIALRKMFSSHGFSSITRDDGFSLFSNIFRTGKYKLNSIKLECLINCGLDAITTIIAQYAGLYINCIKNSNFLYNNMKIYSVLDLGRIPSDIETCKETRENFNDLFDKFKILLDYLFTSGSHRIENSSNLQAKWMNLLERKIQAAADGNYNKMLELSRQFVGEHFIPNNQQEVRF